MSQVMCVTQITDMAAQPWYFGALCFAGSMKGHDAPKAINMRQPSKLPAEQTGPFD